MVHLTGQITRPLRRATRPRTGPADQPVRVPAVRRERSVSETGELLVTPAAASISWQRQGGPAVPLEPPYRLDRVDLKGSYRARLHGLTAGIRLVCGDHAPLFLIAPDRLPLLALTAASSREHR